MHTAQFSATYLGPIRFYAQIIKYLSVSPIAESGYERQTLGNRCYIDSPNGILMLNIPIEHQSGQLFKEARISYKNRWPEQHWQAIKTAYGKTPFFDSLGEDLKNELLKKPEFLLDLNLALMQMILKWLQANTQLNPSAEINKTQVIPASPKEELKINFPPYPQAFDHKFGFRSNLSVIDLIFNEGPAAYGYLHSL